MIEQLPSLTPDPARRARTLSRCRAQLDSRRAEAAAGARYAVERNVLLGFGVVYLSSLVFDVVRVLAVMR